MAAHRFVIQNLYITLHKICCVRHVAIEWDVMTERAQVKQYCDDDIK